MGELHTDIFANGVWTDDILPVVSGDQGDVWLHAYANLSSYIGQIIKFRIRGITGPNNSSSDMAIDDFGVYQQTGVDDLGSVGNIFVAPNPGNGVFNIAMNRLGDKILKLSVIDVQGRIVYGNDFISQSPEFRTKLDLSSLAKGIYTIQAVSGGRIYKAKLSIL